MNYQGFNESDWKLFRKKVPEWQEAYMNRLNEEYILSPEYTNTISKINISVHRNVFALIVNAKDYGSEICLQDQSNADKGKRRGRKKKTV